MDIVKLIPAKEDIITIVWFVGNECNYNCYYCPPYFHDRTKKFANTFDPFFNFVNKVEKKYPNKKISLTASGGEVTLWDKFPEFLDRCSEKNYFIQFLSNGSRNIKWWKTNVDKFSYVIISYHTEFAREKHIRELLPIIRHKGQINMLVPPEKFTECIKIGQNLAETFHIPVLLKYIRKDFGSELYDYTNEQIKFLTKNRGFGLNYFCNHQFATSTIRIVHSDHREERKSVSQIFLSKNNYLQGWKCWGGIDSFFINFDGSIYRGQCKVGYFGNIFEENIALPNEPFTCHKPFCNCIGDLSACRKEKKNE